MTDETGSSESNSDVPLGGVPSEWAPPASSLPTPPAPPQAPTPSLAPPAPVPPLSVSTGPVTAESSRRSGFLGRGIALAAAAVLVGGGGYLAINAGSSEGGADSPQAALDNALAAIANEDLIGAAEFVEPSERETMIDAGFEVIEELVRLDVFDESLDLSSVEGFDFEFDDVEITAVEVQPGLAHLFIESGTATASVDGTAVPLGSLVTDRMDEDDLAITETSTEQMRESESPIVAVERGGRWYLSLWYSIAENALIETGSPRPDPTERLTEIGADSPERAVENFVGALEQLDVATMIGMLDPQEASALYDYAPVFLDDVQDGADEALRSIRDEGWSWDVTDLDLRAESEGSLATVFVDRMEFEASGPQGDLGVSFTAEKVEVLFEGPDLSVDYVVEGDCFTVTVDEGYGADTTSMCTDEMLDDLGLQSLSSSALGGFATVEDYGIVVRNVSGRWYISPIRSGSRSTLQAIRALEPDALAATVDAIIDLARDPFALESTFDTLDTEFGSDFSAGSDPGYPAVVPEPLTTTTFGGVFEGSPYTQFNADLLVGGLDQSFVYDLADDSRDDIWWLWLDEVEPQDFGRGVVAQGWLPNEDYIDLIVAEELLFDSDEALAEWVQGELVADGEFVYVSATNGWGDDLILARSATGIAVVNMYGGFSDEAAAVLRSQVGR